MSAIEEGWKAHLKKDGELVCAIQCCLQSKVHMLALELTTKSMSLKSTALAIAVSGPLP